MHTTNAINITNLVVRIIEGSDKRGSDNLESTLSQTYSKQPHGYSGVYNNKITWGET